MTLIVILRNHTAETVQMQRKNLVDNAEQEPMSIWNILISYGWKHSGIIETKNVQGFIFDYIHSTINYF